MLKWLMRRRIAAFERAYDYQMDYVRDILAAGQRALLAFNRIQAMARFRRAVPRVAWYAAKLAATKAEDCGPCTQIVVTFAEREGVGQDVLRAVIAGDGCAMGEEVALCYGFAEAVLAHDPGTDALRDEVLRRWGQQGLVSLAFAIASARIFPTVKYALGHGKACTRVSVGGTAVPVLRRAA